MGGASLIGSHLTQQLLEAGAAAVILFDNYALGSPEVAASLAQDRRVTAVRGDITRLPELLSALDQVDGVFALAGFLTLPLSQNPGLGLEVNVLGMSNIVEACRYRGVKKVVFASSVATYGNPEVDEVDETTPFYWQTAPPGSCPCSLRLNTRGLPCDRHRSQKVPSIGPSWPLSSPHPPGDALAAGCADARRLLRPASLTASHHRGVLTPLLAVATAARERAAPHAASRHGR